MKTRRQKERKAIQYASAKDRTEKHDAGYTPASYAIPEGMSQFRFKKEGTYELDIIPFIAGAGNPFANKGEVWYERTYYAHRGVGPEEKTIACLKRTFKERCAACDNNAQMEREGTMDETSLKEMKAKERQLFVIRDRNEQDKGLQLFENSYYFGLGEFIDSKIEAASQYRNFFHLQGGMFLSISVKESAFKGKKSFKIKNLEMIPREDDLDEDLLEQCPCLDDLVAAKKLSYKELKQEIDQSPVSDEEDEEETNQTETEDEDEQDSDTEESEDEEDNNPAEEAGLEKGCMVMFGKVEYEIIKISPDGTSLTLETEDGDIEKGIAVDEVTKILTKEDVEEEEDEPKSKKNGNGKATAKPSHSDDDDDDSEDLEDDEDTDEESDDMDDMNMDDEEEDVKPAKKGTPAKNRR